MGAARELRPAQGGPQQTVRVDLPPREEIAQFHLAEEASLVTGLLAQATNAEDKARRIATMAGQLVRAARANRHKHGGVDAFMHEYGLASEEGVVLMCLAEALLRIPDKDTADQLIAEKIGGGRWEQHLGQSDSLFVNASTFGLMLTGRVVRLGGDRRSGPLGILGRLVARSGEPFIRQALRQAMKVLGDNFVLGRTIEEALSRAGALEAKGYRISYDMLGERAKTANDAEGYYERYLGAIEAIGKVGGLRDPGQTQILLSRPSVSVKLSALHPRFEPGKEERLKAELLPRLVALAAAARRHGLGLTIDAEEQDRLDITLGLFGAAYLHPDLDGWHGLGIAVQAYGKRAIPTLKWLKLLADGRKRIPVRLVKGAYWDSEIKWAQERGLEDYPVFTRKAHTDVSYLACVGSCSPTSRPSFRSSPPTTPSRSPRSTIPAPTAPTSCSGCTAWARRSTRRSSARASSACRAASMRPSARTPTSSPTWCAACSRTAPTPPSSTAWPTRRPRSRTSSATPSPPSRSSARSRSGTSLGRRRSTCRSGGTAAAWRSAKPPCARRCSRASARRCRGRPLRRPPSSTAARPSARKPGRSCIARMTGASASASFAPPMLPRSRRRCTARPSAPTRGRGSAPSPARASWSGPPTSSSATACASSPCWCARPARRWTMRWATCARRSTSCATTRRRQGASSAGPYRCRGLPVRPTSSSCAAAGPSCASRPGTSRWRSSRGRWRRRWRQAIPCSPSLPSRPPSSPGSRSGSSTRLAFRRACCISCPATAGSAPRSSRTRAWPASPSRARMKPPGPSARRSPTGAGPSCPSSPRPAGSTP